MQVCASHASLICASVDHWLLELIARYQRIHVQRLNAIIDDVIYVDIRLHQWTPRTIVEVINKCKEYSFDLYTV